MKQGQWLCMRHGALNVADIEAARKFYSDFMGLRVEWEPDPLNVYLTSGMDNIALHQCDRNEEDAPGALDHIGFVVQSPEDVDRWADRTKAYGAEIVHPPRTHRDGARSFYLRDPDQNMIQILFHPPLAEQQGDRDPSTL